MVGAEVAPHSDVALIFHCTPVGSPIEGYHLLSNYGHIRNLHSRISPLASPGLSSDPLYISLIASAELPQITSSALSSDSLIVV